MEKVYVVTHGEYSDYKIKGIFTEKKLAEQYIKIFKRGSEFNIEEYELNPNQEEISNGYKPFYITMTKEGECVNINKDLPYYFNGGSINVSFKGELEISLLAKDEKHAIKIANEKRLQVIAGNHWKPFNFNIKLC